MIDSSDLAELPWPRTLSIDSNGYPLMEVYCEQTRKVEHVTLHRWIFGNPAGMVIDHINGVRHDIRKANLRACTYSQNALNRKATTLNWKGEPKASKYKGVVKRSGSEYRKSWVARVQLPSGGHKTKHFTTEIEAAKGYNELAKEVYGEYAYLNKIEE